IEELQLASQRCVESEIPIYVLGLGANLLVGDQGVDGAVFRLDSDFWRRVKYGKTSVECGAGVDMQKLVLRTCRQGLSGVECLAGIPGTSGGRARPTADRTRAEIRAVGAKIRARRHGATTVA